MVYTRETPEGLVIYREPRCPSNSMPCLVPALEAAATSKKFCELVFDSIEAHVHFVDECWGLEIPAGFLKQLDEWRKTAAKLDEDD